MIKKYYTLILTFGILGLAAASSFAQEQRMIVLKDGTRIMGEVLSFENNVYTVQSSLGQLQIKDQDIVAISAPSTEPPNCALPAQGSPPTGLTDDKIAEVRGQLMADPNFISGAKTIMEDQDIMKTLSQPEIMQAVANQDVNALQSNPQFKELLNNPKILELIQSMSPKLKSSGLAP